MFICFKDRFAQSGVQDVNFYFEYKNLGVSDNHRMAYPFFARKAISGSVLIHMDTHADCGYFNKENRKELAKIDLINDLKRFVNHKFYRKGSSVCPVQYGNWITALLDMYPDLFDTVYLICQKECGLVPRELPKAKISEEELFWSSDCLRTINICYSIDVDYYYYSVDNKYLINPSFSDPCEHFSRCVRHVINCQGSLLFIALSPGCCGGWDNVLPFLASVDSCYGISIEREVQKYL